MKKLFFFASLLISGLTSYAQEVVIDPDSGTDPNPNPNVICGSPYCFTNTTSCELSICFFSVAQDQCTGEMRDFNECITLSAGQTGCFDLKSPENCVLCPQSYMVNVCGDTGEPCLMFTETEVGGQGRIKCNGYFEGIFWHWDPATGTYVITLP